MAIQVNIDENKVDNFSNDARTTLKKQLEKYADDIIKEANLIEEILTDNGVNIEITSRTILQAARKNETYHGKRKKNVGLVITKTVSALSLLLTGFLFDSTGYQDSTVRFIAFIISLIIACVSTVLQFVLEAKE